MKCTTVIVMATVISAAACLCPGGEIGFIEEFSLAEDRGEVLKRLIPGTHEYYYYTCLYHQDRGELDQVDKVLHVLAVEVEEMPVVSPGDHLADLFFQGHPGQGPVDPAIFGRGGGQMELGERPRAPQADDEDDAQDDRGAFSRALTR